MNNQRPSPLAIASLTFSCLGALSLGILAIPGIVCGCIAKNQARRGEYGSRSLAQAGIIVGVVVLVLWLLIPMLFLSGLGIFALIEKEPWIAVGLAAAVTLLGLLPVVFTSMAERRDSKSLHRLVKENQTRS